MFRCNVRKDASTSVVTREFNENAEYITRYVIFDGLLRERQTQGPAPGGGRAITGTLYDSRGNAVVERDTYYNEKASEGGTGTTEITNVRGHTVEKRDHHGRKSEGEYATTTYTYDDIGNIQRLTDNPTSDGLSSDTQCFDYDHQRRLTQAWTPDSSSDTACQNEPDSSALGGVAPYWNSYTYDAVGNRLEETRREGNGTTVREYTIAGKEGDPAHGVSSVAESGPQGESTSSYNYDDAGNMVSRDTGDGKQELTYNAEGNLVNVSGGGTETDYVYDADDERLLRRAGATTTLYLPGMEVSFTAGRDSTEAKRFYEHGGDSVAVRRNDGSLHWTFNDHNGTGTLSIAPINALPGPLFPGEVAGRGGTGQPVPVVGHETIDPLRERANPRGTERTPHHTPAGTAPAQ